VSASKDPVPGSSSGVPVATGTSATTHPKVPELSFFFPAHNEEANLQSVVEEALVAMPALADKFEIIAVDDGSRDRTPAIADELAAKYPDAFRVVHHENGFALALEQAGRAKALDDAPELLDALDRHMDVFYAVAEEAAARIRNEG